MPAKASGSSSCRTGSGMSVALLCVVAAGAYLAIGLVHGQPALAVGGPAIMLGYGAVLLVLRRRSESLALLSGSVRDERQAQVLTRASAVTGQVLAAVLAGGAVITLALASRYATMFCYLCALGGATFMATTVWFARHG